MAGVFHQLYYHYVWATKRRAEVLSEALRAPVQQIVESEVRARGAEPLAIFAMPDHVHLVVTAPPTVGPATFIGQVKGASSHHIAAGLSDDRWPGWQDGYGVVTFRKGEMARVRRYVENQPAIHAQRKLSRILEQLTADE